MCTRSLARIGGALQRWAELTDADMRPPATVLERVNAGLQGSRVSLQWLMPTEAWRVGVSASFAAAALMAAGLLLHGAAQAALDQDEGEVPPASITLRDALLLVGGVVTLMTGVSCLVSCGFSTLRYCTPHLPHGQPDLDP